MDVEQTASLFFFVPLGVAYLAGCGTWLVFERFGRWWPQVSEAETGRKWLDFILVFVVTFFVLGLGQLWRAGLLLPRGGEGLARDIYWTINNLIIYSPVFATLIYRKQGLNSIYLAIDGLWVKLAVGAIIGWFSVFVFLALRGQLSLFPLVASQAFVMRSFVNFLPVFLEGIALAFAVVRLRWVFGSRVAVIAPSLLFALAHVPGSLESGTGLAAIAAFFVFNTTLVAIMLLVIMKSKDVIWLGLVHYLMDVASGAF